MVAFFTLALGLSAITAAVAAPADVTGPKNVIKERGPMNFFLGPDHPLYPRNLTALTTRANTNYDQDYVTGGSVSYSPGTNEFSVTWDTTEDFVVGVGWQPGSTSPITYSGSYSVSSGLGSLSVYGWSTNPLVEYYVMETNVGITVGGTEKGTFTSDGGTYAIWEHEQVNQPSIQGTATFQQYISIRQSPRTSGTVTIENHFNAWASYGMDLGTLNYQVIAVESWDGSGSASQKISN